MRGKAIQFGAGNIGRGFTSQLFHESGMEVVFVDVSQAVVTELNARREYPLHIVGNDAETKQISRVRAVDAGDVEAVAEEIPGAEIVCTAVGANALQYIAPAIALGLIMRYERSGEPLNILICENLINAAEVLHNAVSSHLPPAHREEILARTGFVQAVVSRMVPIPTEAERERDLLAIRAESYKLLPVDGHAIIGTLPPIIGVEPVPNFTAQVESKLYLHNCAHAVLGYLGHEAGYTFGYEALRDTRTMRLLHDILDRNAEALAAKYGFGQAENAQTKLYIADLLTRFDNRELGDTCRRLARDPIRKLAPDDRLIGAARLCEQHKVPVEGLATAIGSALRYSVIDDPSAVLLQEMLRESGLTATLARVCDIHQDEPLFDLVQQSYDTKSP